MAASAVLLGLNPTTADNNGEFVYSELLPGSYVISVQAADSSFACQQVQLSQSSTHFDITVPAADSGLKVTSVAPALNSTNAALNAQIELEFNFEIDPSSVSTGSFSITPEIGALTLAVTGNTVTLQPRLQLPLDQMLLVELTSELRSTTNAVLRQPLRWRFRTASQDSFAPRFIGSDPTTGTIGFPPNLGIAFEFNEPIASENPDLVVSIEPALAVATRPTGRVLYVESEENWDVNTRYEVTVGNIADRAGNTSTETYGLTFTTGSTLAPYRDLQPFWSGALDQIVFSSNRLGGFDLFSIRPDGTELTRITSEPGDELHPSLSHDGKLLAYQARGPQGDWDVFVGGFEAGAQSIAVTAPVYHDTEPSFSSTFSKDIVFVSSRSNPAGLFIMNADGSNPQELDRDFGSAQSHPALHPLLDTQLLFTCATGDSLDVWRKTVSAIDGSAINFDLTAATLTNEHSPAWSRDASYIVYISDSGGLDSLWLADASGEFPRQVTYFDQPVSDPALSPAIGDSRCVLSMPNDLGGSDLILVDLVGGTIISHLTGEEAGN